MESEILDISVLYVEDDDFARDITVEILKRNVKNYHIAKNGYEGLIFYKQNNPDVVITDIRMPVVDGLEMSRHIKAINPDAQIIVTTAFGDTDYLISSIDIGINQFVLKPINKNKLLDALKRCAHVIKLKRTILQKEDQLRHSQRLEAIGQLAGGVAHDFNNILTSIVGYGNILKMKMKQDDPLQVYVDGILTASEKASNLTHSLLAFSRKQIIDPKPIDLNEIVKKMRKMLDRIIGEDIEILYDLSEKDLIVMLDQGQIEQVLINLCTNARDAMLKSGGKLVIKTNFVDITKERLSFSLNLKDEDKKIYVLLSVADNGIGMPENIKKKIFEPFFTTKEIGKGTGLGLAIVYGIVKQHNGYIEVDSIEGIGTTFRVYFPMLDIVAIKGDKTEKPVIKGGTETILLAEDDPVVMNIVKEILKDKGYNIITAVDGEDAIRVFHSCKSKIDLLLFDVIMPKKNGKEAYEEIKINNSDIKVIFISGYTADIINEKGLLDHSLDFISKPVTPEALLLKVREVLDR